ncbi:MAG: hypothetical protein RR270_00725 [Alistipes sp.]
MFFTEKTKNLFEFVTEVILALFLFLFCSVNPISEKLNEDLQGGETGAKRAEKNERQKFKTVSKRI